MIGAAPCYRLREAGPIGASGRCRMTGRTWSGFFCRIVRGAEISEDDFRSAKEPGKPLLDPELVRPWAEGVSVYDTFERAVDRARRYRYKLGRYVVAVALPVDAAVEIEQSGSDPRHHTVYGASRVLRSFAIEPAIRVDNKG